MKIKYDKRKLAEIRYRPVPLLQINNLPELTQRDKMILASLFGHSENFNKISNKRIAESFTPNMNRDRVKESMDRLKELGYVSITDGNMVLNVSLIQERTGINKGDTISTTPMIRLVTGSGTISTTEEISKKEKKKEVLKKETEGDTISTTPVSDLVLGMDGKMYTQEQIDNYEDLLI